MSTSHLRPRTIAEKDYCAHVLFALSDCGATGDWDDMVSFAMRCIKSNTVHACVGKWLRANPIEMQRAYTETQHEEGAR
jgi:hypothetical protein